MKAFKHYGDPRERYKEAIDLYFRHLQLAISNGDEATAYVCGWKLFQFARDLHFYSTGEDY